MGIENNVTTPIPITDWQQAASAGGGRHAVIGQDGSLSMSVGLGDSVDPVQNKEAFDNLFSAIHAKGLSTDGSALLRGLLGDPLERGEPLTAKLIGHALLLADNFAPPSCGDLCRKWSDIGSTDVLSPRTDLGFAFQEELGLVINNWLAQRMGPDFSLPEAGPVLEQMRTEVREADGACPQIKEKVDSILRAIQALATFADLAVRSGNPFLNLSSMGDAYKLVMDGKDHEYGMFFFENERGYVAGMLSAMNRMIRELDQPLTAEGYMALHDTAVAGVHQRDRMGDDSMLKPGYRSTGVQFGLSGVNQSVQGRAEFDNSAKATDPEEWIRVTPWLPGVERLLARAKPAEACRQKAEAIISTYHSEIGAQTDEEGKLRCIAKCCQDLDQHHLFSDGNIRTAAFLTLNKLLLQNGLSPALFNDPNVLDMHSIAEIVDIIKNGQAEYRKLLA